MENVNLIDPHQRQKNELRTIRLTLMKAMRDAATWHDVMLAADTLNSVNLKFENLYGDGIEGGIVAAAAGSLAR